MQSISRSTHFKPCDFQSSMCCGWSCGHSRAPAVFRNQFAQMVPAELTGMNWLLPMYCSSTAEP